MTIQIPTIQILKKNSNALVQKVVNIWKNKKAAIGLISKIEIFKKYWKIYITGLFSNT